MNDNEETRSYNELATAIRRLEADNHMLRTQVAQMRQTIAQNQRADAVAEAIEQNNDVLRSVEPGSYKKARGVLSWAGDEPAEVSIRRLRDGTDAEVDVEFAKFMFMEGALCERYPSDKKRRLDDAIEHWRKRGKQITNDNQ